MKVKQRIILNLLLVGVVLVCFAWLAVTLHNFMTGWGLVL